jgi:hypothetical protein
VAVTPAVRRGVQALAELERQTADYEDKPSDVDVVTVVLDAATYDVQELADALEAAWFDGSDGGDAGSFLALAAAVRIALLGKPEPSKEPWP